MTERPQTIFSILLIEDSDEDYLAFTRALHDMTVTVSLLRCMRSEEALDYLHRRGRFADPAHAPKWTEVVGNAEIQEKPTGSKYARAVNKEDNFWVAMFQSNTGAVTTVTLSR